MQLPTPHQCNLAECPVVRQRHDARQTNFGPTSAWRRERENVGTGSYKSTKNARICANSIKGRTEKGQLSPKISCNQRRGRRAAKRPVSEFPTSGSEAPDPARTTAKTSPAMPVSLKSVDMHQPGCRLPRHHIVRAMLSRTKQGRHQRSSIVTQLCTRTQGRMHAESLCNRAGTAR